jgi:hypothetical protein
MGGVGGANLLPDLTGRSPAADIEVMEDFSGLSFMLLDFLLHL